MGKGKLPPGGKRGSWVSFTDPGSGQKEWGEIIDDVWEPEPSTFGPQCAADGTGWGEYAFTAQRIKWKSGEEQIRVTYYRRAPGGGESDWRFAGQWSPTTEAETWQALIIKMRTKEWIK